jgi:hypothetical protein
MRIGRYHWLAVPILLSGCMAEEPYTPVANLQELMATVVDPAADFYWDAVGWIIDESGTEEIRPQSPEEWDLVRNAAFVVAESGNLMMMQGRTIDEEAFIAFAQAMVSVGQRAIEAAEARDEMGVFDVGAEMYAVCTACHATYALETLRPNVGTGGD